MKKTTQKWMAALLILGLLAGMIGGISVSATETGEQIDFVESMTVAGEANTLNTGVSYPASTELELNFTFKPEASVTRVLLIAKNFAMGTALHDKSRGFVWIDISGATWSYRCDEGMTATVIKGDDGVYHVNAKYTTPDEPVTSMYYHIYSDNGATTFSNIRTTKMVLKTKVDHVAALDVNGNANTLNTGIGYPAGTKMELTFTFKPEASVTRVLLIAKNFAMGTAIHDQSRGFVWIDINGDSWSHRCDEGMTATVIKGDDGVYHVQATYTTPDEPVTSMYYHIYSDNGTTSFADILTTYVTPVEEDSNRVTVDHVASATVSGEANTLNDSIRYPASTKMYLTFDFKPEASVTRVLLIAKNFAMGTAIHDQSRGFVWVDINGETWSARCDEGMNATVTKGDDGVYHVVANYTTPDEAVTSMYYHIYSDNGATTFTNILTTYEVASCTHTNTKVENAVEADCTNDGYSGDTVCIDCGETIAQGEPVSSKGHTAGAAADCTHAQTCTVCGAEMSKALGHNPGEAASCTKAQTCTVCGETLQTALGHDYKDGKCSRCGDIDPNCAHAHTTVEGAANATCTEAGHTGKTVCTDCGRTVNEGTAINALGHTPGAAATCTTAQTCTVCSAELVAALGHNPGAEATCTEAQTCTVCHAELKDALGHKPGAEATCTTAQTCTVCGGELVPALGHSYTDGVCTVCGEKDPKADRATIDFVESITVVGENNTLNTGIRYPANETMYVDFSFVPESGVTRVLLVARAYAPGTAVHDKSFGFVWIDINGDEWSFRSDEGMIFDLTNVTKENGVYSVTAAYTTPDAEVDSMYYHLYSDGGATVISDLKTTYDAPAAVDPDASEPTNDRTVIDKVDSITVVGENNTLNTGIHYPANETMYLNFSFVPENGVTRVLLVAKAYAPGTALHDKSFGFVWIDINGDEWSFRSDEGMIFDLTNVTKENGVYSVTAAYTTPDAEVDSMYYHLYSDGGATVFSDVVTSYNAPVAPETGAPETGDAVATVMALMVVSGLGLAVFVTNRKKGNR